MIWLLKILLMILSLVQAIIPSAKSSVEELPSLPLPTYSPNIDVESASETQTVVPISDERIQHVARVLGNRPLAAYAAEMVRVADLYGLDYRLIPAISIQESGGGQHICGPFNAWGIGGARNCWSFGSWEEGIAATAKILSAPLYATRSIRGKLCMWVSGDDYCTGDSRYADIVISLMEGMK